MLDKLKTQTRGGKRLFIQRLVNIVKYIIAIL